MEGVVSFWTCWLEVSGGGGGGATELTCFSLCMTPDDIKQFDK